MDGFYPYHEMNTYLGLIAIALAVVGAGGAGARDRWVELLGLLIGVGCVLMLGKFTFLFDYAHRMPGSGQLARAGAVPPLGFAGGGRAGGVRRRAARAARRGLAPERSDPGRRPRRRSRSRS